MATSTRIAGLEPLERARQEAARYGTDDWVFVRELLQNARDAGARRVEWQVERVGGLERLTCRDDGEGMTLEHARRYLFTLYASSKRQSSGAAGRFGIGFWSVLRFGPTRLAVRSRTARGPGWAAELSGRFERAGIAPAELPVGTEVRLERPVTEVDIAARVEAAIRAEAPFLRCQDGSDRPLEVLVDGRPVRSEVELPPPSTRFERRGLRGAVGLGATPEVRLYAHGLRVRTAAHLDELLARESERDPPAAVEGLMPRMLLDSDQVEVLMARGDARHDRALERLVVIARAELELFLRRELDRVAPRSLGRRLAERARRGLAVVAGGRRPGAAVATVVLTVFLGVVAAAAWRTLPRPGLHGDPEVKASTSGPSAVQRGSRPFAGLGEYPGPAVEPFAEATRVDLRYRPATARPHFAVLRFEGLGADGRPPPGRPSSLTRDDGAPCLDDCLTVELEVAAAAGIVPLPEPTGGRIDSRSVALDGRPLVLWRSVRREPVVVLERPGSGVLTYRVDPKVNAASLPAGPNGWPEPPPELATEIAALAAAPAAARPGQVVEVLARRLRYDRSPATAAALRPRSDSPRPLVERVLEAGAGDCDVVAAVAGTMLAATGLPVRLALGWVGAGGRAEGGLHAWLEVAVDGRWQVLDPSAGLPLAPGTAPQPPGSPPATAPREVAPQRPPPGAVAAPSVWTAVVLMLVAVAGGTLAWRRRSLVARRRLGAATVDLAELLRGLLQRPEVFTGAGDLEGRPLVPLLGGARLSLRRARRLAGRGELVAGRSGDELAARVVTAGGEVVDLDAAAGRAVADALGVHDLGVWEGRLAQLRRDGATQAVEAALGRSGRRLAVAVVAGLGLSGVVLRGPAARLMAGRDLVVLEGGGAPAPGAALRSPELAALAMAERAADLLQLGEVDRRSLLAPLAAAAVAAVGELE